MSRNKPSSKQSGPTTLYGRPIVYDREIFISICTRLLRGEDLETICAKPPMPISPVFLGWVQDNQEAREIHRSTLNFESDRVLAKVMGVLPALATVGEWEEQVRANCERGFRAARSIRIFQSMGWIRRAQPPVSSSGQCVHIFFFLRRAGRMRTVHCSGSSLRKPIS